MRGRWSCRWTDHGTQRGRVFVGVTCDRLWRLHRRQLGHEGHSTESNASNSKACRSVFVSTASPGPRWNPPSKRRSAWDLGENCLSVSEFFLRRRSFVPRGDPVVGRVRSGGAFLLTLLVHSKRVRRGRGPRPPGSGLLKSKQQDQVRRSRPAADRLCLLVQTKSANKGRAAARGMAFAVGGAADGAGMRPSGGASL